MFFFFPFSLSLLLYIWMMEFYKWWIQNYDEKKSWIPISSTLFRVIQLTWSRSHTQKTQSHLHRSLDIQKCLFTVLSLYLFYLIKKEKLSASRYKAVNCQSTAIFVAFSWLFHYLLSRLFFYASSPPAVMFQLIILSRKNPNFFLVSSYNMGSAGF